MDRVDLTEVPAYGVLKKTAAETVIDRAAEEINILGYAVLDSGLSAEAIARLSQRFNALQQQYAERYGQTYLKSIDEHNTIRLPLAFDPSFLELAVNSNVLSVIERLIAGKFILGQQNGIINPAGERYNQGAWHRDLPYQHFVSSRPIAVNAVFCIDDFTAQNGATYVLPASHKQEAFPSETFVLKNAKQVIAPAGSFIILDCMVFHRGGVNTTGKNRRAVNHVYTIPFIKQQIDIPSALGDTALTPEIKELLGYRYELPRSIDAFVASRKR